MREEGWDALQGEGDLMNLEELIYKRFSGYRDFTRYLAKYAGEPAVFSPEAPDDGQVGWGGMTQYPKAVYSFDLQADGERKSAGTLLVSLLCQNTADIVPEQMEAEVKACLRDVVLKPAGGSPYCFAWARTDAFTMAEKKQELVLGSEIRFDILEFPEQETTDPDPVLAVSQYIKGLYPECLMMGADRMEELTEVSGERPVMYCRLLSAELAEETNTVAWMDGKLAIHILCPDSGIRMKLAAGIASRMSLDGEIRMVDGSPMFLRGLRAEYTSDYLKDGQIVLTGRYGLLRYKAKQHVITAGGVFNG